MQGQKLVLSPSSGISFCGWWHTASWQEHAQKMSACSAVARHKRKGRRWLSPSVPSVGTLWCLPSTRRHPHKGLPGVTPATSTHGPGWQWTSRLAVCTPASCNDAFSMERWSACYCTYPNFPSFPIPHASVCCGILVRNVIGGFLHSWEARLSRDWSWSVSFPPLLKRTFIRRDKGFLGVRYVIGGRKASFHLSSQIDWLVGWSGAA